MDKPAVKDMIYGGISELMKNRIYYHKSTVNTKYSYFTEEGEQVLKEFMHIMCLKMAEAEEREIQDQAKGLIMKGLKGETT